MRMTNRIIWRISNGKPLSFWASWVLSSPASGIDDSTPFSQRKESRHEKK